MKQGSQSVSVVMLPLPAQSHLNQLLHLSAHIATSYGLPVHFLASPTHNRQAKIRYHNSQLHQIHFHDLPTPPIAAIDPDPNSPHKLPIHLWPATEAYMTLRKPVANLLLEMSLKTTRLVIIYDRMVFEVIQDALSIPNTEFYAFNCISAFNLFFILWEVMGKPFELEAGQLQNVPSVKEFIPEEPLQFIVSKSELFKQRAGDIHNTYRFIDGTYIDLISRQEISGSKKQWAIRPFISPKSASGSCSRHECLDWLDRQPPRSVIYVSFGTTTSFSDEEVMEFAMGLEQSNQKFLWVLRDADRADIFAREVRKIGLSKGFEEKVAENGLVLRDWVPQMEILAHTSIGGFMSHCGWNSCLESIAMGVPVAAWPIHSDQPLNAIFLTEVLRIGITVRKWEERHDMVRAERIKNVVERLMASKEGDEMRRRAQVLSAALSESMEEGGEISREFDDFISHITR